MMGATRVRERRSHPIVSNDIGASEGARGAIRRHGMWREISESAWPDRPILVREAQTFEFCLSRSWEAP